MKDKPDYVRPLVICGFSRNGKILACLGKDEVKMNEFYRPLGGAIEFNEISSDALKREIMEEISQEIKNLKYLGTIENIFIYNGKPHHEIVMVYDAEFVDEKVYEMEVVDVIESDWYKAYWLSIEDGKKGKYIIYPEGILDLYA